MTKSLALDVVATAFHDSDGDRLAVSWTGEVTWGDKKMRLSPFAMEYLADQLRAWVDDGRGLAMFPQPVHPESGCSTRCQATHPGRAKP